MGSPLCPYRNARRPLSGKLSDSAVLPVVACCGLVQFTRFFHVRSPARASSAPQLSGQPCEEHFLEPTVTPSTMLRCG